VVKRYKLRGIDFLGVRSRMISTFDSDTESYNMREVYFLFDD